MKFSEIIAWTAIVLLTGALAFGIVGQSGKFTFILKQLSQYDLRLTYLEDRDTEGQAKGEEPTVGAVNSVAGIVYYLYGSGVGTTDTSVTLTSFKQPVSNYGLTMTDFGDTGYLTLEPGNSSRQEFISFTGIAQNSDGTATLSGVTRGLGFVSPYTASSTLKKAHGGGTTAVISNPPQFYERFANKLNTQQISGVWGFDTLPTSSVTCSAAFQFCTKAYIDAGFNAGAATSTFTNIGIVHLATDKQAASSTASSTPGAPLVLLAKFASTTPGIQCTNGIWNCVPVANSAGKLSQTYLNLADTYAWSALHTFSSGFIVAASSTFNQSVWFNATSSMLAFTASSTATSTMLGSLTIAKNASTTGLVVSGQCLGCVGATTTVNSAAGPTSAGASASVTATCPANKVVSGGGGTNVISPTPGTVWIRDSFPASATTWTVVYTCWATGSCSANTMTVYAICVNP